MSLAAPSRRPSQSWFRIAGIAATLLVVVSGAASSNPLPSSVVAYNGQSAPGAGGATFSLLLQPSITAGGDVAFRAEITGAGVGGTNHKGYWRQSGGGPLGLFLRAADPSPIPAHTWSTNVGDPNAQQVAGAARAGFFWQLADGGAGKQALWSEQSGGLRNVALAGGAAAGIPGATYTSFTSVTESSFDEDGDLLFGANLTGGGVTSANDFGLFVDDGATTALVVREGDDVPGLPAGYKFGSSFFSSPVLAPGGVVSFVAQPSNGMLTKGGLWSNRGGALAAMAVEGGAIAGAGAGEQMGGFSGIAGNRHGQIAFWGTIANEFNAPIAYGVWISSPAGDLSMVYRRESDDPGLQIFGSVFVLGDDGAVYMLTNHVPESGPVLHGLHALGASGWRPVAQKGDRVADLAAGIEYTLFDQLVANANGQVGFRATITGPGVTASNNQVLVAHGSDMALHLVARTGGTIEVAPGQLRTITPPLLLPQSNFVAPGAIRAFSDTGGLVWTAQFAGGSRAILVTNLGVPPPVQLVGLEAIQVVQDWLGSVPLIEGKPTLVRAHLESNPPIRVEPLLRARPAAGGPELPFSPLRPLFSGVPNYTRTDPTVFRAELVGGTHWELPFEWTLAGNVEFEVELANRALDCLEAAGPTPLDCKVDADFVEQGVPKVRIVSVDYFDTVNGVRKVSPALRLDLAQRLISAMPVRDLALDFGQISWSKFAPPALDSVKVAIEVQAQQVLGKCFPPTCDRLDFGAFQLDTIDGYAVAIPGNASAGAIPANPRAIGRHTHTHELGHSFGLEHAVDALQGTISGVRHGVCGEEGTGNAEFFPHFHDIGGVRRPTLGPMNSGEDARVYGYDAMQREVVDPTRYFEMMSYCAVSGIDEWFSAHNYERVKSAIATRYPLPPVPAPDGFRGGSNDYLLLRATIDFDSESAAFDPFLRRDDSESLPLPEPGGYTMRVERVGGAITDLSFAPSRAVPRGDGPPVGVALVPVALEPAVERVELRFGEQVLAERDASLHAPVVELLSPDGGETLSGATVEVTWSASDADLDPLTFALQFSADGGLSWEGVATDATGSSYEVPREILTGTSAGLFRVQASDGLRVTVDESDGPFAVADNTPALLLLEPRDGELYFDGQAISFAALAIDTEDGPLDGAALGWSSDLAGALGTGRNLTRAAAELPVGRHVVTVTATDSEANAAQTTVVIHVGLPALLFEDGFENGDSARWVTSN